MLLDLFRYTFLIIQIFISLCYFKVNAPLTWYWLKETEFAPLIMKIHSGGIPGMLLVGYMPGD
jgi:hypothetical protein